MQTLWRALSHEPELATRSPEAAVGAHAMRRSSPRPERFVSEDAERAVKESAGICAYLEALRRSSMSLYEVSDIVGGVSFLARDLVRSGDPVRVFERSARPPAWRDIAGRVVTVLGKTQMIGSVLPFSHQLAEDALALTERVRKKARAEAVKLCAFARAER